MASVLNAQPLVTHFVTLREELGVYQVLRTHKDQIRELNKYNKSLVINTLPLTAAT